MTTNTHIENRVVYIICCNLNIMGSNVDLNSRLKEDLGADSLDASQLCTDLEYEFNITIQYNEFEGLLTVADIIKFIENLKG